MRQFEQRISLFGRQRQEFDAENRFKCCGQLCQLLETRRQIGQHPGCPVSLAS